MFSQHIAGGLLKYLVNVAQVGTVCGHWVPFFIQQNITSVCKIFVDECGFTSSKATFLVRLTFVFFDSETLCMSNR